VQNATQKKVVVLLEKIKYHVKLYLGTNNFQVMKMAMKQNIYQETIIHRDLNTGEVSTVEHTNVVKLPTEPPYVKLYLDDIQRLYDLPNNTILYELLRRMNFDGEIVLNSSEKKKMADKLDMKVQSIDNYLTKLKKADVFTSVAKGTYLPNPSLFGRGEWLKILDRRKKYESIKLNITYSEDGSKTVQTNFTGEENE
jgi:hypothetical protein